MKHDNAVILFSGGLDSTTALYWAVQEFGQVFPLIFSYSQRHHIEVEMAQRTLARLGLTGSVISLPLKDIVYSALIDTDKDIPSSLAEAKREVGVPVTYVPFRNGVFLSLAAAYAESRNIFNLVAGFNLIDSPDYPDTTELFTQKMAAAINQGTSAAFTGKPFVIHTPLSSKNKQEIILLGRSLGADYSYSISCYRGEEKPCLRCPSCDIRNTAFQRLGLEDPLVSRLKKEGKL